MGEAHCELRIGITLLQAHTPVTVASHGRLTAQRGGLAIARSQPFLHRLGLPPSKATTRHPTPSHRQDRTQAVITAVKRGIVSL